MQNRAVIWTSLLACLAVIGVAGVRLSVSWISLLLLVIYLLNTLFLYLYGH